MKEEDRDISSTFVREEIAKGNKQAELTKILFDAQFIAIQRFNRPRVLKLIDKRKAHIKIFN